MDNILSRTKFKKLNEDSTDVTNVADPSWKALKDAWNTSVVGALANTFIGGTINGIYKVFKWGQRGSVRVILMSKLNKEYLKGLVFYADRNGINLTTGSIDEESQSDKETQSGEGSQ